MISDISSCSEECLKWKWLCRFECINEYNSSSAVEVENKVFVLTSNDSEWAIIHRLKQFLRGIKTDKDMGT